ncbi:MAG TPA: zf-HC2 domain-containing protein [Candidatus Angelobacter sp.]|jgi:hypothetical protein
MNARTIEHEEAARNLMAEQYLLGEMTEDERDAYEEHLFSCQICFDQVKVGTELVSQLRQIGPEASTPVPGFVSRLIAHVGQPFTMTVLALLISASAFNVYQSRMINSLKQAKVTPSLFLSDGAKAGGVKKLTLAPDTRFDVSIQVLQPGDFAAYEGRIQTESGQLKASIPISPEQIKDTIHFSLDSSVIMPGTYLIIIHGLNAVGQKTEVTQYSFQIEAKE